MNGTPLFNESEVRKTLSALIQPGAVFEIRALNAKLNGGYKAGTISGYFDSTEKCLEQLSSITSAEAVYVSLNPVHRDLLSRRANRLDFTGRDSTTGDQHIIKRRWLLIDCDAERVSGISASNSEKEFATAKAREVYAFLVKERGWTPPVACDSGNGNHLLFRVDLPAEKVYDDEGADKLFTRTILEKLVANADDAPWAYWFEDALKHDRLDSAASRLARRLKPYGIKPDKIRIGDETGKGYHRTQFKKAWELYLPAYSPPSQKGGTGFTRGTNHRNTREKECSPFSDARVNVHPLDEKGGTQKHEGKTPNVHPVHLVHPIRNKGKDGAFEAVAEQSGEQPAASNEGGGSGSVDGYQGNANDEQ